MKPSEYPSMPMISRQTRELCREAEALANKWKAMRELQEADERSLALKNAELSKSAISGHTHLPPSGFEAHWADCERMAEEMMRTPSLSEELERRHQQLDLARLLVLALTMTAAIACWIMYLMGAR